MEEVKALLKSTPYFDRVISFKGRILFEYRFTESKGKMPDAIAEIEASGIYFCDFGSSRKIFEYIVAEVTKKYGKPEIYDYDD